MQRTDGGGKKRGGALARLREAIRRPFSPGAPRVAPDQRFEPAEPGRPDLEAESTERLRR